MLKTWNPFKFDKAAEFFDSKTMLRVDKFDVVIGNPPYIGEKGNKHLFEIVRKNEFGKRFYQGKMDYFYFFYHLGLDSTRTNSIICFITTNYFLTANGAFNLRKDLRNRSTLLKIVDFNNINIFESAKGQHDIIMIIKNGSNQEKEAEVNYFNSLNRIKLESLKNLSKIEGLVTKYKSNKDIFDGDQNYLRLDSSDDNNSKEYANIINKIKSSSKTLGYYCNINVGIQTGADKVTKRHIEDLKIASNKGDGIFVLTKKEATDKNLEKLYIKQLYKNSDIKKYTCNENSDQRIIYVTDNMPMDSNVIKHLKIYKGILEKRREVKLGRINWYDLWWARDQSIFEKEKIVVPQRSKENTFAYIDAKPWYACTDVFFITTKNNEINLKYLLAILNSTLIYFWLFNRGKRKGKILELISQPLTEIPIHFPDIETQGKIVNIVDQILVKKSEGNETITLENNLDELIFRVYKIEENEAVFLVKFKSDNLG
jgi:adenine-specific DNA-methyltransferase